MISQASLNAPIPWLKHKSETLHQKPYLGSNLLTRTPISGSHSSTPPDNSPSEFPPLPLPVPQRIPMGLKYLATHTHTELLTSLHIKQWGHQDTPELVLTRPSPGLMLVKWTSSRHAHWLINGSVVDRIALSQMPFKVLAYNKNIQKSVIVFLSWLLLSAFKNRKALSTNTWSTNTV